VTRPGGGGGASEARSRRRPLTACALETAGRRRSGRASRRAGPGHPSRPFCTNSALLDMHLPLVPPQHLAECVACLGKGGWRKRRFSPRHLAPPLAAAGSLERPHRGGGRRAQWRRRLQLGRRSRPQSRRSRGHSARLGQTEWRRLNLWFSRSPLPKLGTRAPVQPAAGRLTAWLAQGTYVVLREWIGHGSQGYGPPGLEQGA
jgi:hypothetical protein